MSVVATSSNHRVWSRFNFQLRLAHLLVYDVTCNKTFVNTDVMIWCLLTKADSLLPKYPGARSVFTVTEKTKNVIVARKYVVFINSEMAITNGFSNWLMTDRDTIPAESMQRMLAWSSR